MQVTNVLTVDLEKRSYNILIGKNLLSSAGEHILPLLPTKKVFIVTDDNIAPLYLKILQSSLEKSGITSDYCIIPHGEPSKNFATLENLLDKIFISQPDRKTTLIALGGGVIGDLTGFAASIILRGINFIQIPTSLLAQVDSSVGGKTGINNKFGKNLVGSFYQPLLVLADTDVITSLNPRQFLAGYAEILKYSLINDKEFFNWLDINLDKILLRDNNSLQHIIKTSCASKAKIVSADELEGGVRALLNFGHTFGHALEKVTGYSDILLHGEAVAIGMVFAFKLANNMEICNKKDTEILINHLNKAGLKTSPLAIQKNWDANELMAAMRQDKKALQGKMTFILPRNIGNSFIANDVPENLVQNTINEIIAGTNT